MAAETEADMKRNALRSLYPVEGDTRCIALKLREPRQLYSLLDPAPFHQRELDAEAAQYLLEAARELADEKRIKIVLYFPAMPDERTRHDLTRAIHHYFHYRALKLHQQRRHLLRIGRRALLVGLVFLVLCQTLALTVFNQPLLHYTLLNTGVMILGWVAMWRPVEIFLYEWWPLLQDQKYCERLQTTPVDIRERQLSHSNATS